MGTATQQKWISKLLGYKFSIEYKRGVDNKVADALSRKDCQDEEAIVYAISFPTPFWLEELKQAYAIDPTIQQQLGLISDGSNPNSNFTLKHGVLFRKGNIYVPNSP